jgi:hypothetical protein
VEIHHLETATPLQFSDIRVVASGPLRASVQAQVKYGKSTIIVDVSALFHFLMFLFGGLTRGCQISLDAVAGKSDNQYREASFVI